MGLPIINAAVLKKLRSLSLAARGPAPRVAQLPDTVWGRLRGLLCLDQPLAPDARIKPDAPSDDPSNPL